MAKRKRQTNELSIKNRIAQGRGSGILKNYKPWLFIQDVPSKGLATRIKGIKTDRVHHLLSKLELSYFYCLDWSDKVFDIREQFPLYLPETLAISSKLGIKHPKVPKTNIDVVMTSDFLVTMHTLFGTKEIVISVKYSKDLNSFRTIQKLEIERFYWQRRGTEWAIVTELQINETLVSNIKWVHSFYKFHSFFEKISPFANEAALFMYEAICKKELPLRDVTNSCDEHFSLEIGASLSIVRYLIATRQWIVDMEKLIQPERPLYIINQNLKGGN